ncbi:MAG TPA: hypothetical protein VHX12_00585 [Acidisoma sp.]|nr:hypothetical protein [Acidisoma sp.]
MSFVTRLITLTVQLGQGPFGGSSSNTLTLSGLRVNAELETVVGGAGAPVGAATAIIRVYGLSLNHINQLTKAGTVFASRFNLVAVQAGDAQAGMSLVFNGQFIDAYPDFSSQPNSPFIISAVTGQQIAMKPVAPTSYPGTADAATVMGTMAQNAGLGFEANGVSVKLANPYYPGTIGTQIAACAKAANCYAAIDGVTNTLAVWPKTGSRGGTVPLISAAPGKMINYPAFQQSGIILRTIFNPILKIGGQCQVKSRLAAACGIWNITGLQHSLSCQEVDGPWETIVTAYPVGK